MKIKNLNEVQSAIEEYVNAYNEITKEVEELSKENPSYPDILNKLRKKYDGEVISKSPLSHFVEAIMFTHSGINFMATVNPQNIVNVYFFDKEIEKAIRNIKNLLSFIKVRGGYR